MSKEKEPNPDISDEPQTQMNSQSKPLPIQNDPDSNLNELDSHRFECRSCGYVYDPDEGVKKFGIPVGTSFLDLDEITFACPVCRLKKDLFRDIGPKNKPSGFDENLNYGFGVNKLSEGQKNVLIFGGLALAVATFLSLYSLH